MAQGLNHLRRVGEIPAGRPQFWSTYLTLNLRVLQLKLMGQILNAFNETFGVYQQEMIFFTFKFVIVTRRHDQTTFPPLGAGYKPTGDCDLSKAIALIKVFI